MRYKSAHWWLTALLVFTVVAFWPNFFSRVGATPENPDMRAHMHAWTALAWMALLILQSWAINAKRIDLHKLAGRASRFVFPLVIGGLAAIVDMSASILMDVGPNPLSHAIFYQAFPPLIAYLILYHHALAKRADVWKHSAALLAMPLLLIESPASRVLKIYVPTYQTEGFDIPSIVAAIETGLVIAAIIAFIIWFRDRQRRLTMLLIGILSLAQLAAIYFEAFPDLAFGFLRILGATPTWGVIGAGVALGTVVTMTGWMSGSSLAKEN